MSYNTYVDNSTNGLNTTTWGDHYYPGPQTYTCASCGMSVGSYQVHYCTNQYIIPNFPTITPQPTTTDIKIFEDLMRTMQTESNEGIIDRKITELEARITELEDVVDVLERSELRLDNDQDEKVRIHSEEGCQGTDERGSSETRDRKGDWFWPSKS